MGPDFNKCCSLGVEVHKTAPSWEAWIYQIKGIGLCFSTTKGVVPTTLTLIVRHICLLAPMLHTLLTITLRSCVFPPWNVFLLACSPRNPSPSSATSPAPPPSEFPTHMAFFFLTQVGFIVPLALWGTTDMARVTWEQENLASGESTGEESRTHSRNDFLGAAPRVLVTQRGPDIAGRGPALLGKR